MVGLAAAVPPVAYARASLTATALPDLLTNTAVGTLITPIPLRVDATTPPSLDGCIYSIYYCVARKKDACPPPVRGPCRGNSGRSLTDGEYDAKFPDT